jgi:hypothetical protein
VTRVVLHIGTPKTGTSFVQSVLSRNKSLLAEQSVLWPGATWSAQVRAVEDLRGASRSMLRPQRQLDGRRPRPRLPEATRWDELVAEIEAFQGEVAIISMEWLCLGDRVVAQRALASLAEHDVHVVLTLRDLARAVSAQWQESTKNGHSWTYREFLDGATSSRWRRSPAGRHFWANQDWARMLADWGSDVSPDHFWVVTVPPSGSPPTLLWDRFCTAAGIEPTGLTLGGWANESLGAASAELMRRVQAARHEQGTRTRQTGILKRRLAEGVLVAHRREEPSLALPPAYLPWAHKATDRLVEAVRDSGVRVVGDLEDLQPHPPRIGPGTVTDPAEISEGELLDTAIYGLLGLTRPRRP